MKKVIILTILSLTNVVVYAQSIDYQQRFKDAVAQLDSCRECAVEQLLEIKSASYAPEEVRLNSTIVLANISANVGDIESLNALTNDIEQYIAQHPDDKKVVETLDRLKGYRTELSKQQESFRDRLVGTWVTAEVDNWTGGGAPRKVIEIRRSADGELSATIYSYAGKSVIPEETNNIDIDGAHKKIGIHLGTERMEKANTEYAQALMNQVRQNASESAATKARTGYSDWSKDFSNIFLTVMAKKATIAKSSYTLTDYLLKELAPNILFGKYYYEFINENSEGKKAKVHSVRDLYLYRITNEDSIVFSCSRKYGYWPVLLNDHFEDYKTVKKKFPKGEKMSVEEYNLKAYERLRNKIMKNVGDLDKADVEWVTGELEYGPQGYSWNDGYYVANYRDAMDNKYSYDEKYKGPYKHKRPWIKLSGYVSGVYYLTEWQFTMHDYWKGFKREENFKEYLDLIKDFYGSGVPKYFKMKSDIDSKKKKKNKKEEEEDEE